MNNILPKEIEKVISLFKELPGIGRRGAERIVFSLLKWPSDKLTAFGEELAALPVNVKRCKVCWNLSEHETCKICSTVDRDESLLCIVEDFIQLPVIEAASYRGKYHILGGKLSPLEGITPDKLKIDSLQKRLSENKNIKEVLIALSQDIEGQATTVYLSKILAVYGVKITALARGIPAGADISFANSATLSAAIEGRVSV
jgi:recombination protein RecR